MARKIETKPLFSLKGDFTDSLDKFCQEAIMFQQAVGSAIELGQVSDKARPILQERLDAFRKAMVED